MYEFTVRPTPQGYVAVTITPTMDGRKTGPCVRVQL